MKNNRMCSRIREAVTIWADTLTCAVVMASPVRYG